MIFNFTSIGFNLHLNYFQLLQTVNKYLLYHLFLISSLSSGNFNTKIMKKRRQHKQQLQNQSITFYEPQINPINLQNNEIIISQKHSKLDESYLHKKNVTQPQENEKSCLQTAKQKIMLYFLHFINYLQFDRILTKQQFDSLKTQQFIIKTKYQDNYYLTYEERAKKFGITVDEVVKIKQNEQEKKSTNFWSELKKFICCQGGDQLQQADQMLTAVSQSQYFYLTKMKKYSNSNNIEFTQESILQKPFNGQTKNDKSKLRKMIREQDSFDKHDQIIFGEKKDDVNIFFEEQNSAKINKRSNNKKQIDMQTISKIKKRQHINNSNFISSRMDANQINSKDLYIAGQQNKQSLINNKNTQKVFVHRKSNEDNFEQISDINRQSKLNDENEISFNSQQISKIDDKGNMSRKQSQTTLNAFNQGLQTMHHSRKPSQKLMQGSTNYYQESSNNDQTKYNFHANEDYFKQKKGINFDRIQDNTSFIPLDQSDIISVAQTQNNQISDDQKIRKQNKRKNKFKNSIKQTNDLQVVQKLNVDGQKFQFEDNASVDTNNQQEEEMPSKKQRKNNSISSQQLGKQAKKNSFQFDDFNYAIKEGKQQDDQNKQKHHQSSFDIGQKSIVSQPANENIQISKKKKTRNKKLFNLKQQEQQLQQVVIFPENEQNEYKEQKISKTISFGEQILSNPGTNESSVMKKRKKLKKLKDFNVQTEDHAFVIQAGQMFEDNDIQNSNNKQKIDKISEFNLPSQNSVMIGSVKAQKKRKRKAKLQQQFEKQQQQFDIIDLGELN